VFAAARSGGLDWQFDGDALSRTRKALRLAHDFELDMAAVALVMDLLGEIDGLRSQLPRH
jgi:chaperone modulatory protein CbpM